MAETVAAQQNGNGGGSGLERLIEIGLALSAERNHDRLTERILLEAIDITNSDGGTLYLRTEDNTLKFVIVRNGNQYGNRLAVPGDDDRPFRGLLQVSAQSRLDIRNGGNLHPSNSSPPNLEWAAAQSERSKP